MNKPEALKTLFDAIITEAGILLKSFPDGPPTQEDMVATAKKDPELVAASLMVLMSKVVTFGVDALAIIDGESDNETKLDSFRLN